MADVHNIFGVSIMSLILAFSVIHLGVGIGIIAPDRQYGDIFRPQVGLASFNLVISFLGFVTGAMGMCCVLKHADQLGKCSALRRDFDRASILLMFRSRCRSYLVHSCPVHHCVSDHFSGDQCQVLELSRYASFRSYR
jgi:hypothetical protein